MTIEELKRKFCLLGEGDVYTFSPSAGFFFQVRIHWDGGQTPTYEISGIEVNPTLVKSDVLKKHLSDVPFIEAYFVEQNGNLIEEFQKKIDQFDTDAQAWGTETHNNYLAFYEMHVW